MTEWVQSYRDLLFQYSRKRNLTHSDRESSVSRSSSFVIEHACHSLSSIVISKIVRQTEVSSQTEKPGCIKINVNERKSWNSLKFPWVIPSRADCFRWSSSASIKGLKGRRWSALAKSATRWSTGSFGNFAFLMPSFLGRYLGISNQTERLIMNILGLVRIQPFQRFSHRSFYRTMTELNLYNLRFHVSWRGERRFSSPFTFKSYINYCTFIFDKYW